MKTTGIDSEGVTHVRAGALAITPLSPLPTLPLLPFLPSGNLGYGDTRDARVREGLFLPGGLRGGNL